MIWIDKQLEFRVDKKKCLDFKTIHVENSILGNKVGTESCHVNRRWGGGHFSDSVYFEKAENIASGILFVK